MIYDQIAPYYNRALSRPFFSLQLPTIMKLLNRFDILPGSKILEVACGPGHLSGYLSDRKYRVWGLDISLMQMTTSPNRYGFPFAVAEMQHLPFKDSFDIILNLYDSINHLMSVEDLEITMVEVSRCLKTGGYFIFDTNNRTAFKRVWGDKRPYTHRGDDFTLEMISSYSARTRTSEAYVTVYTGEDEITGCLRERYFTRKEIRQAVRVSQMTIVEHKPWCPSKRAYLGKAVKDLWVVRKP